MIQLKRVYDPAEPGDGVRFLVERLWPRGLRKEALKMDAWLRDVAPSGELRTWFGHDPMKWSGFQLRYTAELDGRPDAWQPIVEAARKGNVTLLFSSHDAEHNNAVVLKGYVEKQLTRQPKSATASRKAARFAQGTSGSSMS